jgi:YidC/Oxa1 family membrane protein insertase
LYRALLLLAKDNMLQQPFLWLPSLDGPVVDYTEGIGWLTEWVNGAPKYGWADTAAYLVLPVLLVLSQYASMELLTPKTDDPAQAQSQAILKFLPLMIGWFSLSVPSGLGLYWLTNNVVTTASTLLIRRMTPPFVIDIPGGGSAAASAAPQNTKGFGGRRFGEVIETQGEGGSTVKIRPPGAKQTAGTAVAASSSSEPATAVVEATVVDVSEGAVEGAVGEEGESKRKQAKKKKKKTKN